MPDPSRQLLAYRPEGLKIGDVGVVIPENGSFDVYFNLCLPRDHPFHQATGVPDNFEPVQLSEMDIRTTTNAENPGRIIATSSVKTANIERSEDATSSKMRLSTLEYEFSLSSSEGALLILPDGAGCEDLRNHKLFLEAAAKHAADWYRFVEEKVGQIISHNSFYLITGLHKTPSWSVAAFEEAEGSEECPARCRLPQCGGGNLTTASAWNTTRALDWRVGPGVNDYGIPNQAVFIRGFKITLRSGMFGRSINAMGRLGGSSRCDMQDGIATDPDPHTDETDSHRAPAVSKDIVIHHMLEASQAFHPSDIINQCLLNKEPSANIAITHDNEWIVLLRKNILRPEDLVQEIFLDELVSRNYHVVSDAGSVYLQSWVADGPPAPGPPEIPFVNKDPSVPSVSEVDVTMEVQQCDSDEATVDEISTPELEAMHVPQDVAWVNDYFILPNRSQDDCVGHTLPIIMNMSINPRAEQEHDGLQATASSQDSWNILSGKWQDDKPTGSFVHSGDQIGTNDQQSRLIRRGPLVTQEPEIVSIRDLGPDNIVIAVMGQTGSGKSTFVCTASGCNDQAIGHTLRSYTNKVSAVRFWDQESRRYIVLVDTPGLDDTYKSDLDILTLISDWLVSCHNNQKLLSGILYLHRITDGRLAGLSLKNLRVLQELCGRDALDKVYLTTTMWDEVDQSIGERRLEELMMTYWKSMITQGARVARCRSDDESSKKLIRQIILSKQGGTCIPRPSAKHNKALSLQPQFAGNFLADAISRRRIFGKNAEHHGEALLIQVEMVNLNKALEETAARQQLYSQPEMLAEKHVMLLRKIGKQRKASSDPEILEELQREYDEVRAQLDYGWYQM